MMNETDYVIILRYIELDARLNKLNLNLKVDSAGFQVCDGAHMIFFSTTITEVKAFCDGYQHQQKKKR